MKKLLSALGALLLSLAASASLAAPCGSTGDIQLNGGGGHCSSTTVLSQANGGTGAAANPFIYINGALCNAPTPIFTPIANIISNAPSGSIFLFGGNCYLGSNVTFTSFPANSIIAGYGSRNNQLNPATKLIFNNCSADGFQIPSGSSISFDRLMIQNACGLNGSYDGTGTSRIYSSITKPTAGSLIHYGYNSSVAIPQAGDMINIEDVTFQGGYNQVQFDSGYFFNIHNSRFFDPVHYAIGPINNTLNFDSGDNEISENTFSVMQSSYTMTAGIDIESGGGWRITNNKIVGSIGGSSGQTPLFPMSFNGQTNASGETISFPGAFNTGILCNIGNLSTVATGGPFIENNSLENFASGFAVDCNVGGNQATNTSTLSGIIVSNNETQGSIRVGPSNASSGTEWANAIIEHNTLQESGTNIYDYNMNGGIVDGNIINGGGVIWGGGGCYNLGTSGGSCGVANMALGENIYEGDHIIVFQNGTTSHMSNMGNQSSYPFHREIPTLSGGTFTTLWRLTPPLNYAGSIEVTVSGQISGHGSTWTYAKYSYQQPGSGATTINQVSTNSTEGSSPVTTVTSGSCSASSANFTLCFITSAATGEVQIQIQTPSGNAFMIGQVDLVIKGPITIVKKGS